METDDSRALGISIHFFWTTPALEIVGFLSRLQVQYLGGEFVFDFEIFF